MAGSDDFGDAARELRESRIGAGVIAGRDRVLATADRSAIVTAARRLGAELDRLSRPERVRLAAIAVAFAVLTHLALLGLVPAPLAPAISPAIWAVVLLCAAAVAKASPR
jgi:hypothetical protein